MSNGRLRQLPPGWRMVRLSDVADQCLGKMLDAQKNRGRPLPYLRNPNVRWFEVDTTNLQEMPFEDHELERYGLREGDILVCEGGEAGRAAIWDGRRSDVKFQKAIHRVRTGPDLFNRFLVYKLMTDYRSGRLADYYTGATIKHFTGQDLARYQIPLPPLPEQRRIAEVLDRAEVLRAKRLAALAHLDTFAQSIFLDMFGDPATNPNGWPAQSLGGVAREKPNNGIFRKNPEYVQDSETGLPVVWVEELFRGSSIDTRESRRVVPTKTEVSKYGLNYGDLLFCRSSLKLDGIAFNNVYLGEDNAALFECHLIRVQPDLSVISPIYLNCLLRLPQMRAIAKSKSKTATMTTIDQTSLCSIPVMLPPLFVQREFACRIASMEKLKTAHRASLAEFDALFASLQYRAFRGEL